MSIWAIISPDEELCFFTRRSKKINKYAGPATQRRVVEEFCMAKRNGDIYETGFPLEYPFNENYNEGGPTITADNSELYFTVCQMGGNGYENCDIYTVKKIDGYWGENQQLG